MTMSTITRRCGREALDSLGITTKDLLEVRIGVETITVTRLARNGAGNVYHEPGTNTGLATTTEVLRIIED